MKKQPEIRSKAKELQQRLITRETYHLVNSKKFGTAASRNERQLEKKMRCLHNQQAKTLAKLRDEIYEVKIHHKMLKEVDETTRDPRTAAEKLAEMMEDVGNNELGKSPELGKRSLGKSGNAFQRQAVIIRNHPSSGERNRLTAVMSSPKTDRSRSNTRLSPLLTSDQRAGNKIHVGTSPTGHKPTFLCGILDMKVKRDAGLVQRFNYNFKNTDKMVAEKSQRGMPEIVQKAKPSQVSSCNNRENLPQLNGNCEGKKNRRATGDTERRPRAESLTKPKGDEETLRVVPTIYVPAVNNEGRTNPRVGHRGKRGVALTVYSAAQADTENETWSSSDDAGPEEDASPTEDWSVMLSKCRYLRKPKGYETPEEPIEAVFR